MAYGVGAQNKRGFWSADTCHPSRKLVPCSAASKGIQVIFEVPQRLKRVKLVQAAADHPQDYIRDGVLEAGFELKKEDLSRCQSYTPLMAVKSREVLWTGALERAVQCLQVRLLTTQEEWVMLRFEEVSTEDGTTTKALAPAPVAPAAPVTMPPATTSETTTATTELPRSNLRHKLLLKLQAYRHEDHQESFATMIAASAGLLAGLAGWVQVYLCQRLCMDGVALVGQFPCWISSFLPVLDSLLLLSLKPPEAPCQPLERRLRAVASRWWPRRLSATSWPQLFTPARRLAANPQDMLLLGRAMEEKAFLALGMRVTSEDVPLEVLERLLEEEAMLLLHLPERLSRWLETLKQRFSTEIEAGRLVAVRAPEQYYPDDREHYELAVLFAAASSLSHFYLQVEEDAVVEKGFVKMLRDYMREKDSDPRNVSSWNMISLARDGLRRKVMRSHQLIRFAELLPIFPEAPPDSLLWDYVDVINNQSAPKACYISFSATKMKRTDVLLQYHKAEAIIEHVGDVSSLEGKVQRIHDDYFKKHNLLSSLFDNPAAELYSGSSVPLSVANSLQAIYGVHGNSASMGGAPSVTFMSNNLGDLVGKATVEIVFKQPTEVQMLNLRMGGFLRPAAKNKKQPELADPDFDFVFPRAEVSLGRGKLPPGSWNISMRLKNGLPPKGFCTAYEHLMDFSGREVFWRSPRSRPAANVECIKVTLLEAPKSNVILRTVRVRSTQQRRLQEATATWQEEMQSWTKNVAIAFAAGALAGLLGCVVSFIPHAASKPRKRTKVSQA